MSDVTEPEPRCPLPNDGTGNEEVAAGALFMALCSSREVKCEVRFIDGAIEVRFGFLSSPYRITLERMEPWPS